MQVRIPEQLWASAILPEGALERWRVQPGEEVIAGAPLAEVRIEQALHEIVAPCTGRLTSASPVNAVLEPGSVIAEIVPTDRWTHLI
jgi:pyruvate/2-oxoglutarate dehydrogenase complex dihydrolipoamide acyltransferase (E2) component